MRMLPPNVIADLQSGQRIIAHSYRSVSVLFADIMGFDKIVTLYSPEAIVNLLDKGTQTHNRTTDSGTQARTHKRQRTGSTG